MPVNTEEIGSLKDYEWVSDSFMVNGLMMDDIDNLPRFTTLVNYKFTDTSLGGNVSLNVYPQFTRYADIRYKGIIKDRANYGVGEVTNIGMGRYYGEAIDDNSVNVYFEFGVPEFNNFLMYMLQAVDYKKAVIANEGRTPTMYTLGEVFGIGAVFLAFPVITASILAIKAVSPLIGELVTGEGRFDQYYLKPTMFTYWSTVNSIVNMMAAELGLITPAIKTKGNSSTDGKIGVPLKVDEDGVALIRKFVPDLVVSNGAINIHGVISKAQRLYVDYIKRQADTLKTINNSVLTFDDLVFTPPTLSRKTSNNLWEKIQEAVKSDPHYKSKKNPDDLSTTGDIKNPSADTDTTISIDDIKEESKKYQPDDEGRYSRKVREEDEPDVVKRFMDTLSAIYNEGARYAVFRVESTGSVSESFSNSVTSVEIGDYINNLGEKWRSFKFNVGMADVPILGDVIKGVTDFAAGALDGLTLGFSNVVASFLSGAKLEVPKRWQDSSVSLPSLNFKMTLISPSAHPYAQLTNIYIPLAAILAGTLPLATGPRSYTSPFLCSMFIRGQQRVKLGMITSLSVSRGTTNLPFNKQMRPLGVDVSFTVTDFYDLISAPVVSSLLDVGSIVMDEYTGINRYIAALCGRNLYTSTYFIDKLSLSISKMASNFHLFTSPEYWGARLGDIITNLPAVNSFAKNKAINYSELY